MTITLQHLNNPAFSLDHKSKRIVIDVNIKDIEDLKSLDNFYINNISIIIEQYKKATASLLMTKEIIKEEKNEENCY